MHHNQIIRCSEVWAGWAQPQGPGLTLWKDAVQTTAVSGTSLRSKIIHQKEYWAWAVYPGPSPKSTRQRLSEDRHHAVLAHPSWPLVPMWELLTSKSFIDVWEGMETWFWTNHVLCGLRPSSCSSSRPLPPFSPHCLLLTSNLQGSLQTSGKSFHDKSNFSPVPWFPIAPVTNW